MKKIYLSGPMKGIADWNYPLFNEVAAELRAEGHTVYNPAEYPFDGAMEDFPVRKALAAHCRFICEEADTIALLPGWQQSGGSAAEVGLAIYLGLSFLEREEVAA